MQNIRKDSTVGIIEKDDIFGKFSLHFSEWWNGEGMDFTFDEDKRISLHIEEIHTLVVSAIATGMIDMESVEEDVQSLLKESEVRKSLIEDIRSKL